jgi:hypothetical protein
MAPPLHTHHFTMEQVSVEVGEALHKNTITQARGGPDVEATLDAQSPCAFLWLWVLFAINPFGVLKFNRVKRVDQFGDKGIWVASRAAGEAVSPFVGGGSVQAMIPTRPWPSTRPVDNPVCATGDLDQLACMSVLTPKQQASLVVDESTTTTMPIWALLLVIIGCDVDGTVLSCKQGSKLWCWWMKKFNQGRMPITCCMQLFVAAFSQGKRCGNTVFTSKAAGGIRQKGTLLWMFDGGCTVGGVLTAATQRFRWNARWHKTMPWVVNANVKNTSLAAKDWTPGGKKVFKMCAPVNVPATM